MTHLAYLISDSLTEIRAVHDLPTAEHPPVIIDGEDLWVLAGEVYVSRPVSPGTTNREGTACGAVYVRAAPDGRVPWVYVHVPRSDLDTPAADLEPAEVLDAWREKWLAKVASQEPGTWPDVARRWFLRS